MKSLWRWNFYKLPTLARLRERDSSMDGERQGELYQLRPLSLNPFLSCLPYRVPTLFSGRIPYPSSLRLSTWLTRKSVPASRSSHQMYMRQLVAQLSTDPAYFKKVYRYTFVAGKEGDQRALALDNAIEFWRVLFSPPGRPWRTASHDWLELWTGFLGDKWTRSVNRDMWNQLLEFATRTLDDETLAFWSEDGAWPSVIDDFVAWCKERGIGSAMDTDA